MSTHSDSKREALLQAAGEIVIARGADHLTLEAVAKHAQVSKGGLLYHFPTKEVLLAALLRYLNDNFAASLEREVQREKKDPASSDQGRWLRAYVRLATMPHEEWNPVAHALLMTTFRDASLPPIQHQASVRLQHRLENDGVDPLIAKVIRLAADGCWLGLIFRYEESINSPEQLLRIRETLLRMVAEGALKDGNKNQT